jgi:hypothetical protein
VTRIVLVQCTAEKRDGRHRAKNLYDESTYFRKQRAYAQAKGDYWLILSAKYGLVDPNSIIDSYDLHVDDLEDTETWATDIATDLADGPASPPATVEILGGRSYADPLVPELERLGYDVVEPLCGLGIGERMSKLAEMTTEVTHARLSR